MPKKALLIVDFQNDFCPKGSLAVKDADKIVSVVNEYISKFNSKSYTIFASADWHPADSKHFDKNGGLWPVHCVAKTKGAEFHPELRISKDVIILHKGTSAEEDGYSAIAAKDEHKKELKRLLIDKHINEVYVCGLATDYCVKSSVLDLVKEGFKVFLLIDAVKAVNLKANDEEKALKEMADAGVVIIKKDEIDI